MRNIRGFRGTFSSNNTPYLKTDQSVIINFSKFKEEGTHFIAIIALKNNKCIYFDPLCIKRKYIPSEIKKYCKKYLKVYNISKKIQNNESIFCGFFCMLAIISYKISKRNLYLTLESFTDDSIENDRECIKKLKININAYFKNRTK